MYRSTSDYSLAPPSHSLIASPVHVIIPPHQHSNSNCQYRNSHITVIMKFSTVKTSRIQKADGAADGQDIESRTHYYTRINRDYRENNFHSIYYHHPHLLCSYLPSSYKPLSIQKHLDTRIMLTESLSTTWTQPRDKRLTRRFRSQSLLGCFRFLPLCCERT